MTYPYVWLPWSAAFLVPWLSRYAVAAGFRREMLRVSALTLAASFAAYVFYARWFISVWCFFAAGLGLVILVHFTARNPAPIGGAVRHNGPHGRRKQYHPSLMGAS